MKHNLKDKRKTKNDKKAKRKHRVYKKGGSKRVNKKKEVLR